MLRYIRFLEGKHVTVWKAKDKVIEQYNASSEMYAGLYGEEQQAKYLNALKKVTLNNSKVLDVGCGSGLFFKEIAEKSETIVGVDISLNLLRKAKIQAKKYSKVHVILSDADHLPLKPDFFDLVFSFTVLQNMPAPRKTIQEIKAITRKDGKIIISGLKKAFQLNAFLDLLESSNLQIIQFTDDDSLKCYIAVTTVN